MTTPCMLTMRNSQTAILPPPSTPAPPIGSGCRPGRGLRLAARILAVAPEGRPSTIQPIKHTSVGRIASDLLAADCGWAGRGRKEKLRILACTRRLCGRSCRVGPEQQLQGTSPPGRKATRAGQALGAASGEDRTPRSVAPPFRQPARLAELFRAQKHRGGPRADGVGHETAGRHAPSIARRTRVALTATVCEYGTAGDGPGRTSATSPRFPARCRHRHARHQPWPRGRERTGGRSASRHAPAA